MKLFILTLFCIMYVSLSLCSAGSHNVILTPEQEIALTYDMEQANLRQVGQKDTGGNPLPALTADQVLTQGVQQHLANELRNLDAAMAPFKVMDSATQALILTAYPSQAARDRAAQLAGAK